MRGQIIHFQIITKGYFLMNINWNDVIESLQGEGSPITADPSIWNLSNPEYEKIYNGWKQANFNIEAVKWINFYPEKNFDKSLTEKIASNLKVNIFRSWISRIDPGYFAPWHWDVDDNEDLYMSYGYPRRFTIFMNPPTHGHIFIVDDKYYFNQAQGLCIEWKNYKDWHSGINAGMTPNYMFHLLGW